MLWIALLLGSVTDPLLAQIGDINVSFDSKLDAEKFKKDYPGLITPATLEVQLSKGNVLLLRASTYSAIKRVQRPDSLLRIFWESYGEIIEKQPLTTDGLSVRFEPEADDAEAVRWEKFPQPRSEFSVLNQELVRIKSVLDTLKIKLRATVNQPEAEMYLLINDLRDLPQLLEETREKTAYLIEQMEKETDPVILDRSPEAYGRYLGDRNVQVANFGSDMLIISPAVSLGYIRGNWMTSLNADFTLYLEKSHLKPRVGYHQQYFFSQAEGGKPTFVQNGFISAGLTFFQKTEATLIGRKPIKQSGQLTLGYLVHRRGAVYEPQTWRLSGGFSLSPFVKLEPEVYFNGFFKKLSPGLRISVGL